MVHSATSSQNPTSREQEESNELARFREEWRAELAKVKAAKQPETSSEPKAQRHVSRNPDTAGASGWSGTAIQYPAIQEGTLVIPAVSTALRNAIGIYRTAVQHEQRGELDVALGLYRQAFRLDPRVDLAYRREELLLSKVQSYKEKAHAPEEKLIPSLSGSSQHIPRLEKAELKTTHVPVSGTLAKILSEFPPEVEFEPEDETALVHINILPLELVHSILRYLDVTSITRFARVSRRALLLSLDPVYWSNLVTRTYKPPQLLQTEDLLPVLKEFNSDFRRVFIEQPRVRMDGIYIAICHYTRAGLSEDAWMTRTHLITYHRYLRFFTNGKVLSLLTNEQNNPQEVIPLLKPSLRTKGFFIGNWYLDGTTLNLVNLLDASGRFVLPEWGLLDTGIPANASEYRSLPLPVLNPAPIEGHGQHHNPHQNHGASSAAADGQPSRYIFDMTLELRSKPLGRWNKLEIKTYDSINLETGDVIPFPLKNERPFWFSKVRSYSK